MDVNEKLKLLIELFINYEMETNDDITLEEKTAFINWILSNDRREANDFQRRMKRLLDPLLNILLESKGNLKYADCNRNTILHYFLKIYVLRSADLTHINDKLWPSRELLFIEKLIENGACVFDLNYQNDTPLGIAASKKRLDLIPAMLTCTNVSNAHKETVLHILIDKYVETHHHQKYLEFIELVRDLLSDDTVLQMIDNKEHNGMTAAHFAAQNCYVEILEILKEKGADLNVRSNAGEDLLMVFCKKRCTNIWDSDYTMVEKTIDWLLNQGFDLNSRNNSDYTPLHYISGSGKMNVVTTLVKAGADINAIASDNLIPLHCAAIKSHFEIMKYLIECGSVIPKKKVIYGLTLLHLVSSSSDVRKLKLVIDLGFNDMNVYGENDVTPLHLACKTAHADVAEELIARGADVHCRTKIGRYTPLHLASMCGRFQKLNVKIFKEDAPFKSESIVKYYHENWFYTKRVYHDTICKLLQSKADVNAKDQFDRRPLHFATQGKFKYESVFKLLEAGAHVNVQDANFLLPLHNVLEPNDWHALLDLLKFGADINEIETPCPKNFKKLTCRKFSNTDLLLYHAVKLQTIGLPISDLYKPYLNDLKYRIHRKKCFREIEKLKTHMITKNVSVYNFLRMNPKQQCKFVNFLSFDLESEFPVYHAVIQGSIRQAIDRQSLFESSKLAFKQIIKVHLPDLCIDHIFSYLSNRYLRVIFEML